MPPESTNATDHELLLLLNRDLGDLRESIREALEQLRRGNERFQQIALRDQEVGAAIADLRQNYSRAMLTADQAKDEISRIRLEITLFKAQIKMIAWIAAPITGVVVAIATDFIRRQIFP